MEPSSFSARSDRAVSRVSVHQIVHMLANGDTLEGLIEDYPNLTRDDVLAALELAAALAEKEVTPIEPAKFTS